MIDLMVKVGLVAAVVNAMLWKLLKRQMKKIAQVASNLEAGHKLLLMLPKTTPMNQIEAFAGST